MDCSVFFWFLISCCLVSYTLALLCGVCLVLFFASVRDKTHNLFSLRAQSLTLAIARTTHSANSSTTNTTCYWLQVHSDSLEGTAITHIFRLLIWMQGVPSGLRFQKQHSGACRTTVHGLALTREILN